MKFGPTFDLLDSHKTMTSRVPAERWYGWYRNVNQQSKVVMAEGPDGEKRPIRLIDCGVHKLGWVKEKKFWEEGFSKPSEFEDIWRNLYGRFNPDELVCSLEFEVLLQG